MYRREALLILSFINIVVTASDAELPHYLKRCSRASRQLNDCLKSAIEDGFTKLKGGDKAINVQPYDPLKIDEINISKNAGIISLEVYQRDAVIHGFGDGIKLSKVDFNFDKKAFAATLYVPKLYLEAHQILRGRIIGIPLLWQGYMSGNLTKVKCDFVAPFDVAQENGKEFAKFNTNKLKLNLDIEKVKVHHKESSSTDTILAITADRLINDNWRLVVGILRPCYEDLFRKELGKKLSGLFDTVPLKGIFLD